MPQFDVSLDDEATALLADTITGGSADRDDWMPVRLMLGEGHSGHGLYVLAAEYPEEGSIKLAEVKPADEAKQLFDAMRTAARYRAGNTALLEALMDMVNQHFRGHPTEEGVLMHNHVYADENAIQVLYEAGMAQQTEHGWLLRWNELEKRKPKRETWAEAVNGLKDITEEERARLLALDDSTPETNSTPPTKT